MARKIVLSEREADVVKTLLTQRAWLPRAIYHAECKSVIRKLDRAARSLSGTREPEEGKQS